MLPTLVLLATTVAASCDLPARYNWTSSDILAEPRNDWWAIRDFTTAPYKGDKLVYATTYTKSGTYGSMGFEPFAAWSDMASAGQTAMKEPAISPKLFYFAPKDVWILAYQWSSSILSYKTSKDPADPNGWSDAKPLVPASFVVPKDCVLGPVDPALIGDDDHMYLLWACDNGRIYRTTMPIDDFPGTFGAEYDIALEDKNRASVFEGVQVYRLQGQQKYLMTVEAIGSRGRYLRSFTAETLTGEWVPDAVTETTPFAGFYNNDAGWTKTISQGELVRVTADQTMTIDACNLELLYMGLGPVSSAPFNVQEYRPAVLTLVT